VPAASFIVTLSLHDALPIFVVLLGGLPPPPGADAAERSAGLCPLGADLLGSGDGFSDSPARLGAVAALGGARVGRAVLRQRVVRSEEHTSELQSRENLVCRL